MRLLSQNNILGLKVSSKYRREIFRYACIGIGILLFGLLKLIYKFGNNDLVYGLTFPTNYLFSIIENSSWIYNSELGFFHEDLNIIIDKSCCGGNFFILCMSPIYFSGLAFIKSSRSIFGLILISGMAGYGYTIFINVSRISILSMVNEYGIGIDGWTHEAIGSFVYLSALVILFLFQSKITNKLKINE